MSELTYDPDWEPLEVAPVNPYKPAIFWNRKELRRMRHKLRTVLSDFAGLRIEGETRLEVIEAICKTLRLYNSFSISDSLSYYEGSDLTVDVIDEISWQFPGNKPRLAEGEAIRRLKAQPEVEWVLGRVIATRPLSKVGWSKSPGFAIKYFVYTGHLAGRTFVKEWVEGYAPTVARWWGLPRKNMDWFEAPYLLGMYSYIKLYPPRKDEWIAEYKRSYNVGTLSNENRKRLKARFNDSSCPHGYKPGRYETCMDCHCGYSGPKVGPGEFCELAVKVYTKERSNGPQKPDNAVAAVQAQGAAEMVCAGA